MTAGIITWLIRVSKRYGMQILVRTVYVASINIYFVFEINFSKSASQSAISRLTPSFIKTESSNDMTSVAQWDFEEPFKRTSCSCTSSSNISR